MKSPHVIQQISGMQNFSIEKYRLSFSIQNTITFIILDKIPAAYPAQHSQTAKWEFGSRKGIVNLFTEYLM